MPREYRQFAVTTPHGTQATDPQRTQLVMPPRVVTSVRIRVPPGPRGELGFALGNAGTPVIPLVATTWLVTDDETIPLDLTGYSTSGTWDLLAYNTGTYDHTIYLTFGCTLPGASAPSGTRTAPVGQVPPVGTTGTVSPTTGTALTLGMAGGLTLPPPPAVTPVGLTAPPTLAPPPALPTAPTLAPPPALPGAPVLPAPTPVAPPVLPGTAPRRPPAAPSPSPPTITPEEITPMAIAVTQTGTILIEKTGTNGHQYLFKSTSGLNVGAYWTWIDITDAVNAEGAAGVTVQP